jgi:hypothetical protein
MHARRRQMDSDPCKSTATTTWSIGDRKGTPPGVPFLRRCPDKARKQTRRHVGAIP